MTTPSNHAGRGARHFLGLTRWSGLLFLTGALLAANVRAEWEPQFHAPMLLDHDLSAELTSARAHRDGDQWYVRGTIRRRLGYNPTFFKVTVSLLNSRAQIIATKTDRVRIIRSRGGSTHLTRYSFNTSFLLG